MSSRVSAVVVSAGSGTRFQKSGGLGPKQFIEWDGKPLFVHTLEALSALQLSELVLVIRSEDEEIIHRYSRRFQLKPIPKIVFGGARRQDSVRLGLEALSDCDRVFIHDAARPFLSRDFLVSLVEASKDHSALIPALHIVETLKEVDGSGAVVKTHDRNRFVRVQTPQVFDFKLIRKAHESLKNSENEFTDDAAMLEFLGHSVQVVSGNSKNIKVTVLEDLRIKQTND